jgi:hypothetical protein
MARVRRAFSLTPRPASGHSLLMNLGSMAMCMCRHGAVLR